jgi:hypothetical protein
MLPQLKNYADNILHVVTGKTMELLVDRIRRQTPIAGANMRLEETSNGLLLHANKESLVAPVNPITFDFQASLASTDSLAIASGRVIGTTYGTINQDDPAPTDWLEEQFTVSSGVFTVPSGSSVWLQITASETDLALTGALPLTDAVSRTITTGGGGGGGSGGGGGATGDQTYSTAGTAGGAGGDASGQVPGGRSASTGAGGTSAGEGTSGTPANGSNAGNGGAGGAGETKTFTNYDKLKMTWRRWQITGATLVVAADKPVSSATSFNVRIASQTGGVVTQYQAGSFHICLPTISYIVP